MDIEIGDHECTPVRYSFDSFLFNLDFEIKD